MYSTWLITSPGHIFLISCYWPGVYSSLALISVPALISYSHVAKISGKAANIEESLEKENVVSGHHIYKTVQTPAVQRLFLLHSDALHSFVHSRPSTTTDRFLATPVTDIYIELPRSCFFRWFILLLSAWMRYHMQLLSPFPFTISNYQLY